MIFSFYWLKVFGGGSSAHICLGTYVPIDVQSIGFKSALLADQFIRGILSEGRPSQFSQPEIKHYRAQK